MRVITATVRGFEMVLSDSVIGASGSHKTTAIELILDNEWEMCDQIEIYFNDAHRKPSVFKTLTAEYLNGDGNYVYPIPWEPLRFPGTIKITLRGHVKDGDTLAEIKTVASCEGKVLDSGISTNYKTEYDDPEYGGIVDGMYDNGDIVFKVNKGIVLKAEDGGLYRLTVDNNGYIIVTKKE